MIPVDFTAAMLAAAGPAAGPSAGLATETVAAAQPENAALELVAPAFGAPAPEALPAPVSVPPSAEDPLPVADPAAPSPDPAVPPSSSASTPAPTDDTDFEIDGLEKPNDPLEPINRFSFKLFWAIDAIAIRPAAMVYRNVVPKPLRDGARNAMTNLSEPLVFANDVLQLRPKRALKSLGRFLINSVFG
jgi:phospholipid-binding lipoprotein MlaA